MENIVRRSAAYYRWRAAFEEVVAATGDQKKADDATLELHRLVVAEHPIYGPEAIAAGEHATDLEAKLRQVEDGLSRMPDSRRPRDI